MVCYYHPDRPAAGSCRHCQRGLCMECAASVEDTLACRGRHEQQVAVAQRAMTTWIQQAQRIGAGYFRNGLFYSLVAAVFVALGVIQYRFLGLQAVFLVLVGIFLAYAAATNFLEARKYH